MDMKNFSKLTPEELKEADGATPITAKQDADFAAF